MDKRNARIILVVVASVVALLVLWGVMSALYRGARVSITTNSAPTDMTLTIDGKKVKTNATFLAKSGPHSWKAVRAGFSERGGTFTLTKGKPYTLIVFLQPNSAVGIKYLADHPTEAYRIEGLVGTTHDILVQQAKDKEPIIGQLPYIGPGFEYRVDYGHTPAGAKYPNKEGIYISADSDSAKQDALDWIRSQGFNPDTMNIIYESLSP